MTLHPLKVGERSGIWSSLNLCTKKRGLEMIIESARLLNATAIVSGYAGRDPHGGTAIEAFQYSF